MLGLKCTTCGALLELDDAFAGGVCRCIHCGTIQTVPSQLRPTAPGRAASFPPVEPLADPVNAAPFELAGPAIDPPKTEDANIPVGPSPDGMLWKLVYGLAAAIVLGIGVVIWLLATKPAKPHHVASVDQPAPAVTDGGASTPDVAPPAPQTPTPAAPTATNPPAPVVTPAPAVVPTPAPTPTPTPPPVAAANPTFCGVALNGKSVVYLVDRSSVTAALFEPTNKAVIASIQSLRTDQQFQIIYWGNKTEPGGTFIPSTGMVQATPAARAQAIADIAAVKMGGDTLMQTAVVAAAADKPELILFISGKSTHKGDVPTRFHKYLGGAPSRVDTFCLGAPPSEPAMKQIAEQGGGEYKFVSVEELNQFGK